MQLGPQYSSNKLSKFNFLVFIGENPKLWITNCKNYFELYSMDNWCWIASARVSMRH